MPYNPETNKPLQLYPTIKLHEKLAEQAKKEKRSIKNLAEKILEEYYENQEKGKQST